MNIHVLKYNNYFNRICKFENSLSDYTKSELCVFQGVNFIPNDGIATVQDLNISFENLGDYLIAENNGAINSRWFIIDSSRLRNGQYRLRLRRDVFVDFYKNIIKAPVFIEKAKLQNWDPMIYNNENMTFNQIKTTETPLKDLCGCPWIVGYLSSGTKMDQPAKIDTTNYEVFGKFEDFVSFINLSKTTIPSLADETDFLFIAPKNNNYGFKFIIEEGKREFIVSNNEEIPSYFNPESTNPEDKIIYENLKTTYLQTMIDAADVFCNAIDIEELLKFDGRILKSNDGKYFKITISTTNFPIQEEFLTDESNLSLTMVDCFHKASGVYLNSTNFCWKGSIYTPIYDEIPVDELSFQIDGDQRHLEDAPYDMFCIPFGAIKATIGSEKIELSYLQAQTIAMNVQSEIVKLFGGTSGNLFDIQILPYCPIQNTILSDGSILVSDKNAFDLIKSGSTTKSFILWANSAKFSFTINHKIEIVDKKIENECDFHRIVSPNFNGQFEFSAAKNNGVEFFVVDCEYKPYQPYIHIAPNFKNLYGENFGDPRGLVCSGDFSLTQISDAWETYKRQNVNFENIFNRQIENMQFNNSLQNIQTAVGGITGTLQGIASGAASGGLIGGILGGVGSAIGGGVDYAFQKSQQAETIDYTKDLFGYNLGNIRALPNSLTKVSAFNPNNKIFPILEYYTCTKEEKQALKNKIKFNGMTVGRIGTIEEFLIPGEKNYIKGKLIRMEGLKEDFNVINQIASEILKGVFI